MKNRCHGENGVYRKKKISVCSEWHNFENFKNDMHYSYMEHLKDFSEMDTTLDRIDNKKNYNKSNCRWATRKQQNNNRLYCKKYILNGKEYRIEELCDLYNLSYGCLLYRLKTLPVERAIILPRSYKFAPLYTLNGRKYTIKELSILYKIPKLRLWHRLEKQKIPIREAVLLKSYRGNTFNEVSNK